MARRVNGRRARFEALLPPGVRSATTLIPGQARAARRCSPGVLSLQSFLHYGSGSGHSRRHTQGARGPVPRAPPGAQPSRLHTATWTPTPGLASPGSADTQSLENPAHHRQAATQLTEGLASPVQCASRQPHPHSLPGVFWDGASCPCPLSAAPRASLPFTTVSPRRGAGGWTSKTLSRRTVHQFRPLRGELATGSLAEPDLVPRHRVDLRTTDFRQPRFFATRPFREEQIRGGPPCRQVGRLSWAFVPRRVPLGGASLRAVPGLFAFRIRPFRA
jgi:hypothetical protein